MVNYAGVAICWGICAAAVSLLVCYELFKENFWVKLILPCIGVFLVGAFFHCVLTLVITREASMRKHINSFREYSVDIKKAIVKELNPTTLQNKLDGVDLR